ncbi:MAG: D-alanyl-D-alanine carboxypeptidase family protein [Eubacteriales bacterium]|nr:D-alanyl-D-alanine carboxypeptidase family protein [Eubacteriales bacterium]
MKIRHIAAVGFMAAAMAFLQVSAAAREDMSHVVQMIPAAVDMETKVPAGSTDEDGPGNLYALSAVLMDADSGRVLYDKEGEVARANASTTKVMTCILALENAHGDDYVTVSKNAAAQPDVQLNIREGEQYYLEDLLYSLMLKSHNDSAVAIAEHIGGSVSGFADMMNAKAKELGCTDTHFVTPNGLDAKDGGGEHHTTARDLALIMRYAIQNETFLRITQTRDYSFSDITKKRQFSIHNANALLDMMDGVISGKTGFTGNAGYCYVCACEENGKTFIVALLGCGWPSHKTYKWSDTKALLKYGEENFEYQTFWKEPVLGKVKVENGVSEELGIGVPVYISGTYEVAEEEKEQKLLVKNDEAVKCKVSMAESLKAPVRQGQKIGEITYYLEDEELCSYPVLAEKAVDKMDYMWCVDKVFHDFFH